MNRIGNYRLLANIGRGGMAEVYLALSTGLQGFQKLLVLKTLKPELAADPEFIDMFLAEARVAALLNHPNVVQTYEVGRDGERPFIAMEYLEGQPLSALLARVGRDAMPTALFVHVIGEMLAGLQAAHEATDLNGSPLQIVHRDVSPHNVFVTYAGQVKLLDFGIAKVASSGALTKHGTMKGKVGYMAPEQAMGLPLDRRADIFAAGVMLWEAVMRKRLVPPNEDDTVAIARRLAGQDPPPVAATDSEAMLATICARAMARAADERFDTAAELRDALEAWQTQPARSRERELARLVERAFETERSAIRKTIEAQVAETEARADVAVVDIAPVSASGINSEPGAATMEAAPPTVAPPVARARSTRRRAFIAGAAVGVAAVVGATLMAFRDRRSEGADVGAPSATMSAPPASATADAPIVLRVTATPESADIEVDGLRGPSPFEARLPRGAATRTVRVSAPGYEPDVRTLTLDRDLDLVIALRPVALVTPIASASASTAPPKRPPPPRPSARPATKPPASAPTSGSIDEKDPYRR